MSAPGFRASLPLAPRVVFVAAALLAAFAAALPAPLAAAALAVTFLVAPGVLVSRATFGASSREIPAAAALALAPALTGIPVVALMAVGVPLAAAARAVAFAVAVASLLPSPARGPDAAPGDATARAAWLAAAAWTLLMGALLVGNRYLPPRSDGWYHAATTLQVLQRGIPPEDPFFAGIRMLYFWGLHVWAAAWLALAPRLAVWTPFVCFNLAAATAVVLAIGGLARRLGAGPRLVAFAAALATLGYSPFGWMLVGGRAMTGDVRGLPELRRLVMQGVDPLLGSMAARQLHGSMSFFGDKYLVLTQFSLGLAQFALFVIAALELSERPRPRAAFALGLLVLAALFTHTVIGYVMLLVAAPLGLLLLARALRREPGAWSAVFALSLAVVLPLVLLSPYLVEITMGKRGQFHAGFSLPSVVTMLAGGLAYVVPGFAWLQGRARRSREAQPLLLVAVVLAILAMSLKLPENNQSKFFNLLFLVLAAPAAFAWAGWLGGRSPRVRRIGTVALACGIVPTAAFAVWGFANEHGQTWQGWKPPSAAMIEAMAWARTHTPPDAAFCDIGGGQEVLTLAGRSVIWGGYSGERDYGYDPEAIRARRDLAGSLCRGLDPGPSGAALLAGFPREVIVMTRAGMPDSLSDHGRVAARPERFEPLWHDAEIAFWRVRRP